MNKYLEKVASIGARIGHVAKPPQAMAVGKKLIQGDKTLLNAALHKAAQEQSNWKHDAIDAGVIGGLGGVTNFAVNKAAPKVIGKLSENAGRMASHIHNAKLFGLGAGAGLVADYAGVKLNKAISHDVQKQVS